MKNELSIDLAHLHNDQHFQFFGEFGNMVTDFDPAELKIEPQFIVWVDCFKIEDISLKRINKSPVTAKIYAADKRRDCVFRGMAETCKASSHHFKDSVKEPATDLMIVFDTYGNLAKKPLSEKTSAIANLLTELKDNHSEQVEAIGLTEWVHELSACNNACYQLIQERWDEAAANTKISMKQARANVDIAYNVIIERILALKLVEGGEIYDKFLNRLQVVIDSFNSARAQRVARNSKDDSSAGKSRKDEII